MSSRIVPFSERFGLVILTSLGALLVIFLGMATASIGSSVLLVTFGLGAAALIFARPRLGFYAMLLLIPFDVYFLIAGEVTVARIIGILTFGAWLVRKLLQREKIIDLLKARLTLWLAAFIAFAMISALWADYRQLLVQPLFTLLQLFLFFLLAVDLMDSWQSIRTAMVMLLISASITMAIAFHQFFVLDYRRAGDDIIGSQNAFASLILLLIPLLLYYAVVARTPRLGKMAAFAMLPFSLLAIAISVSRTSIILLPIVFLWQLKANPLRKRLQVYLIIVLSVVVVSIYIPWDLISTRFEEQRVSLREEETRLMGARGFHWQVALAEFRDNPILGVGYNNYGPHFVYDYQYRIPDAPHIWSSPRRATHSLYLAILANLGLVGIVLFAGILISVFVMVGRALERVGSNPDLNVYVKTLRNCLIAYLLYSLAATTLDSKLLWLLFAIVQAVYNLTVEAPPQDSGAKLEPLL